MKKNTQTVEKYNFKQALEKRGAKIDEKQEVFLDAIREVFVESAKNGMTDEKIAELVESKVEAIREKEGLVDEFRSLSKEVMKIKETGTFKMPDAMKSQLRSIVNENFDEIIKAVKEKRGFEFGVAKDGLLEIRAAAPHYNDNGTVTLGTGIGGSPATALPTVENFDEGAVATFRTPANFILDIIRNTQVDKVPMQRNKRELISKDGDVAIVAEHNVKPLIQYKGVINFITRNKYAGRIEFSEEFEMDNEQLFAEIVKMFERDVITAWNNGLYSQIIANAIGYTGSVAPLSGLIPFGAGTAADAAMALQAQIMAQEYTPDVVVINPANLFALLLKRDANGNYVQNPNIVNGRLNGMRIVTSNSVDVNYVLVLESGIYSELHSNLILRAGQYDKQLIYNQGTLIGEVFSLLDVAQLDLVGSAYDEIDTILADIEQAQVS